MMQFAKPALLLALFAGMTTAGWAARGWYEGNQQLAIAQDRAAIAEQIRADVASIAGQVETKLAKLKANERVIDRGVIREIEKPVYQRVCFEPELIEILNRSLRGEADGIVQ